MLVLIVSFQVFALIPAPALAEPTSWTVTEFSKGLTGQPELLAASPDGSIWFTESGDKVGRITGSGEITEYSVPGQPGDITVDSVGDAWIGLDERDEITRVTPAGVVSDFSLPAEPIGVTFGLDGNLWYTDEGSGCTLLPKLSCVHGPAVGRLTPTGAVTEFPLPEPDGGLRQIITGPDGNLWFGEGLTFLENPIAQNGSGAVGRITPSGVPTDYPIAFGPDDSGFCGGTGNFHSLSDMTVGPDGNIWAGETDTCFYSGGCCTTANIARITPQGVVTLYFAGWEDEIGAIASGPGNALWLGIGSVDDAGGGMAILGSTTTGVITEYGLTSTTLSMEVDYSTDGSPIGVYSLAAGPEGDLWFTGTNGEIGRVNFHGIPPAAPTNTSPPTISGNAKIWQTLSCNPGSWSGSPLPTFSYQWQRDGIAVSGATSPSYTVELPDIGHALTCVITAENSAGTAHVTSAAVHVSVGSLSSGSCPDVAIFGARGSGEDNTAANVGMGPVPYLVAQQIRNDLPIGLRVEMIGVNYPAVPALAAAIGTGSNYLNSVVNGAEVLVEGYNGQVGLVSLVRSCPKVTVVLVGLSQGAHVIHYAMSLAPPHPSVITSRIAAILLFGDPVHQPNQSYNVGSQTAKGVLTDLGPLPGNSGPPNIVSYIQPVTQSYCLHHDPICESTTPGNLLANNSIHSSYGSSAYIAAAASFAVNHIKAAIVARATMASTQPTLAVAHASRARRSHTSHRCVFHQTDPYYATSVCPHIIHGVSPQRRRTYTGTSRDGDKITMTSSANAASVSVTVVDRCGIVFSGSIIVTRDGVFDGTTPGGFEITGLVTSKRAIRGTITDPSCENLRIRSFTLRRRKH